MFRCCTPLIRSEGDMRASESCLDSFPRPVPWSRPFARIATALGNAYCRTFHRAISRPVNGKYHCWRCLREFDPGW